MSVQPGEWTFALVDLAGFTALTEAHGDELAADLAVEFARMAESRLRPGDRLVKAIGDAVLLASPSPQGALTLVRGLIEDAYESQGFPISRAGLHHGRAVERSDDLFGAAVNLTARIAAQAAGGQILATADVAKAAAVTGIETTALGEFRFRNVADAVELWDLALVNPPSAGSVDPVCRMYFTHGEFVGQLQFEGRDFWFCSLECAAAFAASPQHFVR